MLGYHTEWPVPVTDMSDEKEPTKQPAKEQARMHVAGSNPNRLLTGAVTIAHGWNGCPGPLMTASNPGINAAGASVPSFSTAKIGDK